MDRPDCIHCGQYEAAPELDGLCWECATSENGHIPPSAVTAQVHTPPDLARDQRILDRFAAQLRMCGVVGEDRNAKLVYLAITSRVLEEPVSESMKGVSSSGKSYTIDQVLAFFPEEAYIELTAMSERALIYDKRDFAHRTLVLFEAVALREQREKTESNLTAYFVRTLLSEGRIRYPVTVRNKDGGFVTQVIEKEGPTNIILSTTATSLHNENETRMISLPTNDSREQTAAVLKETARRRYAPGRLPDLSEWRAFQRWIAGANHKVDVPYADWLAEQIPPVAVRLRRDFAAILGLIEAHAILHQLSRETDSAGRIVASEEDYLEVRDLVVDLVAQGVGATVSPTVRETVCCVAELAPVHPDGVTTRTVEDALKLDRSVVQRRLQAARERGYVENLEDRRGRPARYRIADPMPEEVELLPHTLAPIMAESAGR
jgi:hypothetical protein